jgi:hypothetical protein
MLRETALRGKLSGPFRFLETKMRISHMKANKHSSRIKTHTTGGGKRKAHNVKGKSRHGRRA